MRGVAGDGIHHRAEAFELVEFRRRGPAALHYYDQRQTRRIGFFVDLDGLADAIIFDDELFGLEPIDGLTRLALNPCGEKDEVRAYGEFVVLGIGLAALARPHGRLLAGGQAREKKCRRYGQSEDVPAGGESR